MPTASVSLSVQGLNCASCVGRVEKALTAVTGVNEVAVNLATETAKVNFAPDAVSAEALATASTDAGYPAQAPGLIIEVLSESTELMDRQVKKEIYQRFGVSNYWLADPATRQIEYMALKDKVYQMSDRPDQIALDNCQLKLDWSQFKV